MKPTTSPWDWKYLGNIPGVCTSEVLQGPTLSRHLNKSQRTDTPLDKYCVNGPQWRVMAT